MLACSFQPERLTKKTDKKYKLVNERSVDHFQKLYDDRITKETALKEAALFTS